ncbi:MAG: protein-glutamate O-methyltransferase CheR [Gemmatimonadaceae bacterium]
MSVAPVWTSTALAAVAELVRERTGLVFPATRRDSVEEAVARESRRLGLADLTSYRAVLEGGGAALDALVANLTIGETYFFREPSQLDVIRREVLPALARRAATDRPARAWSAACAGGEEAYTLAILLREGGLPNNSRVLGTDIARDRLAAARRGRYGRWSLRTLDPDAIDRYFARHGASFQIDPAIRAAAEFRYLNLAEDSYPASSTGIWGMDLILCRNVLIYFDRETVQRVATRLVSSLADDGWLFLGASDPPLADLVPCEVVVTGAGLAYRKPSPARLAARRSAVQPALAPRIQIAEMRPSPEPAPAPRSEPPAIRERVTAERIPVDDEEPARLYAARDFDDVVLAARRAREDGRDDVALAVLLVRSLANLGRLDEAGKECAAALDEHRQSAELLDQHALLLGEAQQVEEAAAAVKRALYLDRGMAVAHLALATLLSRLDDRAGASRSYRNAEALLAQLAPDATVPAADGEPAHRLLEIARAQRALLDGAAA